MKMNKDALIKIISVHLIEGLKNILGRLSPLKTSIAMSWVTLHFDPWLCSHLDVFLCFRGE